MKTITKNKVSVMPVATFEMTLFIIEKRGGMRRSYPLIFFLETLNAEKKVTTEIYIKNKEKLKSNLIKEMILNEDWKGSKQFEVIAKLLIFENDKKRLLGRDKQWKIEKITEEIQNIALKKKDLERFIDKNYLPIDSKDFLK